MQAAGGLQKHFERFRKAKREEIKYRNYMAAQTQQELAAPTAAEWLEGGSSPGRSPLNVEKGREAGMSTQVQIHLRLTIGDVEIP